MRAAWLWCVAHAAFCAYANAAHKVAASSLEVAQLPSEKLVPFFMQHYSQPQEALDDALVLLRSLIGEPSIEFDSSKDQAFPTWIERVTSRIESIGLPGMSQLRQSVHRWIRRRSAMFPRGDYNTYTSTLRVFLAHFVELLVKKPTYKQRGAHTYYDMPLEPLWPNWDFDHVKAYHASQRQDTLPVINGWEQAMWGPFIGPVREAPHALMHEIVHNYTSSYTKSALVDLARANPSPDVDFHTASASLRAVRTHAIRLLEWVAYPPDDDTSVDAMLRASFAFSNETSRAQADALWILGEHYFWGTHGSAPNMTKAYQAYERLSKTGNATAHSRLGYMHSSPFLAKVYGFKGSDTDAIVHLALATQEGDWLASNAMGYRLMHGIGTSANCTESLVIFDHLARRSHEVFEQGPPGGRTLPYSKVRLSDRMRLSGPSHQLASGQGFKAFFSVVPFSYYRTQAIIKKDMNAMFDQAALEELMDQYSYLAHEDPIKQFEYASALYFGSIYGYRESLGAIRPNPELAAHHALSLATSRWPIYIKLAHIDDELYRDGYPDKMLAIMSQSSAHAYAARNAAVLLGVMYLRGEGVPQDFKKAKVWLTRAAHEQQPLAMSYLGMMYANGYGGLTPNMTRAWNLFKNSHEKSTLSLLEIAKQHISTYGR